MRVAGMDKQFGALVAIGRDLKHKSRDEQLAIVDRDLIISRPFETDDERRAFIEKLIGYAVDPRAFGYHAQQLCVAPREPVE